MDANPKPYQWDFDGSCAPRENVHSTSWKTFSLGIFQWIPKSSGKGLKRGKVVRRVKGYCDVADEAYAKAQGIVDGLNKTEPKR